MNWLQIIQAKKHLNIFSRPSTLPGQFEQQSSRRTRVEQSGAYSLRRHCERLLCLEQGCNRIRNLHFGNAALPLLAINEKTGGGLDAKLLALAQSLHDFVEQLLISHDLRETR